MSSNILENRNERVRANSVNSAILGHELDEFKNRHTASASVEELKIGTHFHAQGCGIGNSKHKGNRKIVALICKRNIATKTSDGAKSNLAHIMAKMFCGHK